MQSWIMLGWKNECLRNTLAHEHYRFEWYSRAKDALVLWLYHSIRVQISHICMNIAVETVSRSGRVYVKWTESTDERIKKNEMKQKQQQQQNGAFFPHFTRFYVVGFFFGRPNFVEFVYKIALVQHLRIWIHMYMLNILTHSQIPWIVN